MGKKHRAARQKIRPIADTQFSGYDGANLSIRRGQIFWPTLDTRRELDSFSRSELMRRVRWLVANVGFVRALVKNSAFLVGWVTPQAMSSDRAWNRLAEKRFSAWSGRAATFDAAGKYNWETAQLMLTRNAKRDGEMITVLTTTADRSQPRLAFYESHQLASPPEAGQDWDDGVRTDASGRHIAYGIRTADGTVRVFPAASVIYHGEFESPGHTRGIPPLAHAVNHAIDITEIRADTKHAIKTSSLFGAVKETAANQPATKSRTGMAGTLSEVQAALGGSTARRFESRDVWGGGQIPELNPGEKIATVHDERPSPNQMAFMDELIRDISLGFGLPPEVIWKMASLTGPGVRFVMEYASRWIEKEQSRLWDWAERVWWYFLGFETRTALGFPADGGDFMAVEFIPPRDLTIDRGRDGKQRMEEIDRGLGTVADWHRSISGASGEDKIVQRIDEVAFAMAECAKKGVPYELAFPPRAGAAPAATATEPQNEPPSDPEEP